MVVWVSLGFPGSSAGRESPRNAGDPGSIPGSESPPAEGIATPVFLGFHGGSDGKQPAYIVGDLGWEDPLEEGMATHSNILSWRILRSLGQRSLGGL